MNIALIRTMDSQGRIVIPAEIRKQMKLSDGDALDIALPVLAYSSSFAKT